MARLLRRGALAGILLAVILVPFALFGGALEAWAAGAVAGVSPRSVLAGVLIAGLLAGDIVLPTPSSLVSTAAGALLGFGPGALASWLGMTAGCVVGYLLGTAGRGAAVRIVGASDLERVAALLERFGIVALALLRPVPVLAEASVMLAGLSRIDFRTFFWITAVSNAGISLAYAAVGAWAERVSSFLLAFLGAILLPGLALALVRAVRRRRDTASAFVRSS